MIDDISHLFPALNVETNYRVVYRGKLLEGHKSSSVASALKDQFRMTDEQISAFLSEKKFIVRKDMPRANAARLRAKLRKAGLDVVANSRNASSQNIRLKAEPQNNLRPESDSNLRTASQPQPSTAPVQTPIVRDRQEPQVPAKSRSSRWIIIGACSLFTLGVLWVFFSI